MNELISERNTDKDNEWLIELFIASAPTKSKLYYRDKQHIFLSFLSCTINRWFVESLNMLRKTNIHDIPCTETMAIFFTVISATKMSIEKLIFDKKCIMDHWRSNYLETFNVQHTHNIYNVMASKGAHKWTIYPELDKTNIYHIWSFNLLLQIK